MISSVNFRSRFRVLKIITVASFGLAVQAQTIAMPHVLMPSHHSLRPRSGWLARNLPNTILYVADAGTSDTITLYDAETNTFDPPIVGAIIDGVTNPVALATDRQGDVFVANAASGSNPANVQMYARGSIVPAMTYTADLTAPIALATDKSGALYVANATGPLFTGPSIVKFPAGSTTPASVLTDPNVASASALAIDTKDDAFVSYSGFLCCPPSVVDEFQRKQRQPLTLALSAPAHGSGNAAFAGLALDNSGNLLASHDNEVDVFAPSVLTWPNLTQPAATISMGRPQSSIALDRPNARLFGLDPVHDQVIAYAYPSSSLANLYTQGIVSPTAVAVFPPAANPAPSPQPPPPNLPKSVPPSTVYLADRSRIDESDAQGKLMRRHIAGGVADAIAMAVDSQETLYIADYERDRIALVPFGSKRPLSFLTGLTSPVAVAVSGDETVAVALSGFSENTIVVYPHGNVSEPVTLQVPRADSIELDTDDDIYYTDSTTAYEFTMTASGYVGPATLFSGIQSNGFGQSLLLDTAGDIVATIGGQRTIGVFPPGHTSPLYEYGQGILTTTPSRFAFDSSQKFLYVLDGSRVVIFRYPSGSPFASYSLPNGNIAGVALAPAAATGSPWSQGSSRRRATLTRP